MQRPQNRRACGNYHVRINSGEFGGGGAGFIGCVGSGEADIDFDIAPLDPAVSAHRIPKSHTTLLAGGIVAAPTDPDYDITDAVVLLRPRYKRPSRRAAEQRHELPPPHAEHWRLPPQVPPPRDPPGAGGLPRHEPARDGSAGPWGRPESF